MNGVCIRPPGLSQPRIAMAATSGPLPLRLSGHNHGSFISNFHSAAGPSSPIHAAAAKFLA
jgi:hypothetical protein